MARQNIKSADMNRSGLEARAWVSDTQYQIKLSNDTEENKKSTVNELARCIRGEISLFMAFIEARNQYDGSDNMMEARLLQATMLHRQTIRELLLIARQRFNTNENWQQWLRDQCLIDESIADHYMRVV